MYSAHEFITFRNPRLSVLQSAIDSTLKKHAASAVDRTLDLKRAERLLEIKRSFQAVADKAKEQFFALHDDMGLRLLSHPSQPRNLLDKIRDILRPVRDTGQLCGKLLIDLAEATAVGDQERIREVKDTLKFSNCDVRFVTEIAAEYAKYFSIHDGISRQTHKNLNDFVQSLPTAPAGDTVRIALFADWGTGRPAARALIEQIASKRPHVLIHLGDIYYSGVPDECRDRFTEPLSIIPESTSRFTLAGNHDMYSGGEGYYALLKEIGQPASYFCLRNADWQLLAMDTGFHGHNPVKDGTHLETSEVEWLLDKINNSGGRRTVLLSHHQPFSAFELKDVDGVNAALFDAFKSVMDKVDVWFWGHEHKLTIYNPFCGLKRGRCIGHGAIPVHHDEKYVANPKKPADLDFMHGDKLQPVPNPQDPCSLLPIVDGVYARGYALLELSGKNAKVEYFDEGDFVKARYSELI